MGKMKNKIYCPLCEEELEYIPYKDSNEHLVHIYSHDNTCPFIAFEFVDNEDLRAFNEYLKEMNKFVKKY